MGFNLDDILRPEHENNALAFVDFLKTTPLIDDMTIGEYLKQNTLGFFVGKPPEFTIRVVNAREDSPLQDMAEQVQVALDEQDRASAFSTTILVHVPLGSLNQREDLLTQAFREMADNADNFRKMFQGKVSDEKLSQLKTGDEVYEEAWQRHWERVAFLNPDKLSEIKEKVKAALDSERVQAELTKLYGNINESDLEGSSGHLLTIKYTFEGLIQVADQIDEDIES